MNKPQWWQTDIVYQIYPRSFQDTNGDGIGDLPGIIEHLDYLNDGTPNSLGVGAIWLNPIYPSPLYDFGYDISNYQDVDPTYGTLADFDRLVLEAQRRGIRIIMDLVANHTSHLHPWFQQSRSSRHNPYRDWYYWRDAKTDGSPPNNWVSVFGGPAWTWDETTRQFYLHAFLKEQPDLNWYNPAVRKAIVDVMRFWMDRGVAGFRLDAIAHIGKHPDLPDNPLHPEALTKPGSEYEAQEHRYDKAEPIMIEWLGELRAAADEYDAMLIGEIYDLRPTELARFTGPHALNAAFNFDLLLSPWDARAFRAAVDELEAALPPDVWPSPVLSNHDKPRSFSRYNEHGLGMARARIAAMMLLTLRGSPYIYYGEEIGMHDVTIPRGRLQDPVGKRHWPKNPGRDPERTPMQWDTQPYAGFSTVEPWLPLAEDYQTVNVAIEAADPHSLLTLYRRLSWIRRGSLALRQGSYRSLDVESDDVYAYLRSEGDEQVLIVLNFGTEPQIVDVSSVGSSAEVLLTTSGDAGSNLSLCQLELAPTSGFVLRVISEA